MTPDQKLVKWLNEELEEVNSEWKKANAAHQELAMQYRVKMSTLTETLDHLKLCMQEES